MKRVILAMTFLALFSFMPNPTQKEKTYKIEFSETQINNLWNTLEFCKASIRTSTSPAIDVARATNSIDSIEVLLSKQYVEQQPKDSTKHKK